MKKMEKMMKFYFNDVEVTEAEYNQIMEQHARDSELGANGGGESPVQPAKVITKAKSRARAKPYVSPTKAIEKAKAVAPKAKGSKTDIAAGIIARIGKENKQGCVEAIMAEFNTNKGNASCYYFNVLKKLG